MPKGLEGEEEDEGRVQFEKRRERLKSRSGGKRKSIKDKDWILKKKEVRLPLRTPVSRSH